SASIGHGWATIQLLPGDAGLLELRQHWHPAWQASVDGIDVQTFAFSEHPYAPIRINVPANAQEVNFRYGYTATGQIGLWISLLSLLLGLGFIYRAKLDNLATRCRVPAICFLATLFFYYQTATPNSQSSEKQIADISVRIALSEVAEEKTAGSDWNAQGNLIMDTQGVVIELNELKQQPTLSLTLDNNERYLISLLRDGKVVERLYTDIVNGQRGIALHKLAVSPATYNVGYDAIAVIPLGGDGYYSLGHLHLLDEPLRESKAKSLADNNHIRTLLLDKLSHFRPTGTLWNAAGNTIFTEQGLQLAVEKVANNKRFEVSLDSNDIYMVYFFRDKNLLATVKLPMPNSSKIGLFTRRVSIPEKAYTQGYDRIGLLPLSGDNYYSLGHFVLLDD
ncbi:MAG: hypothetical protein GY787_21370, partial [Alteromonadales bacterium]|nr:hypothetical protein [Alteromonadales bacterium]